MSDNIDPQATMAPSASASSALAPVDLESDAVIAHVADVDAVFGQGWVCVGHTAMLANVGDYFTLDLIGNPLVVVRGGDRIRVLSRVCRHRWVSVAEGYGNTRLFTCPFHAWAYALDGSLVAAPFMEAAEGFDAADCSLPEARTEFMDETGLIFINLSEAGTEDVDPPEAFFEIGLGEAVAAGPLVDVNIPGDWRSVVDHVIGASPGAHFLFPNVVLSIDGGAARLDLVYPNGPGASLVRKVSLLGVAGEAVMSKATKRRANA